MKVKILFLIFLSTIYIYINRELNIYHERIKENSYKEEVSNEVKIYQFLGIKKISSDLLLIKQTANIGEVFEVNRKKEIIEMSLRISQINPFLIENYYVSSNVLIFIKKYESYNDAEKILRIGLNYNPNDVYLKKYLASVIAMSKGQNQEALNNYEDIVEKYPDPLMLKVVYNIYFSKVKVDKKYLEKYLYYAEKLYNVPKYKKIVERDLKTLKKWCIEHNI